MLPLASERDSESTANSERSAVGQRSTAIKSHSGDKPCLSPTLEASLGWGIVKGEGATSQFKPLPLNKKEKKESKEVNQILEVKAKDSEKLDSESKRLTNRDISGYRPQYDKVLESYPHANPESTTDSESKRPASRDISLTAQYDNNSESKTMDCHAGLAPARK